MATLTSADLRRRLVLQPRHYQFADADNLYDLNWVDVAARLVAPRAAGKIVRTRLATWELASMATHVAQMAAGERAQWQPRFFDSGLHLAMRRSNDRPDLVDVVALVSAVSGPLPVDIGQHWRGDRLVHTAGFDGLRFSCSRGGLELFAHELQVLARAFPQRQLLGVG